MKNYFTLEERSCPCCGVDGMNPATLARWNALREDVGFPINMSSGYRCPAYNTANGYTQTHATGGAGDAMCSHKEAYVLAHKAPDHGFTGIGVSQKGAARFLHLDDLEEELPFRPRPHLWSY